MSYGEFHTKLRGRQFTNKAGEVFSKLTVWIEYGHQPAVLKLLSEGLHPELTLIDKPGWHNGVLHDRRTYSRTAGGELVLGTT